MHQDLQSLLRCHMLAFEALGGVPIADMKYAARPLAKLYGSTLANDFGPLKLKAVREHMIAMEDLSLEALDLYTETKAVLQNTSAKPMNPLGI